jgi:hypothetical protein
MIVGQPTQCDLEFPFGPPATQIAHGKSISAESMPKKTVTLAAHFCQLNFTDQARAAYKICLWRWLALGDALAPAETIRKSTNSQTSRAAMRHLL